MVTIELDNGSLHVLGNFSYTRQVGDIGDVATSNGNFTNAFDVRLDKTAIKALKGLSLVGSLSSVPYVKTNSILKINGIDVINQGWLQVKESNKSVFKLSVLNGNVDFWKAIEGVSLADIDLSETDHDKNIQSVIDSFTNPYYKYILADYGGQTNVKAMRFNIDHLPPAISEDYIFRRIFKYIGMTYQLPVDIDTWLTYPKDTSSNLGFEDGSIITADGYFNNIGRYDKFLNIDFGVSQLNNGASFNGTYITELERGYYNLSSVYDIATADYLLERRANGDDTMVVTLPVNVYINISGERYTGDVSSVYIEPSDIIEFEFVAWDNGQVQRLYAAYEIRNVSGLHLEGFKATIKRYIFEEIRFGDALKDIKATDFIKYLMHRYGFTLFYDNNKVVFKTIKQRLEAETIDYSRFFKERQSEKYVYSNYAQQNILAHKYVDDDIGFNDGIVYVNNRNLREETTLLQSFTYSPTREGQLTIFETEVTKDENDVIDVNYKGIDRNFSIKQRLVNTNAFLFSTIQDESRSLNSRVISIVILEGTTFKEYKNLYYLGIEKILNNAKIHKVNFRMSVYMFLQLDLSKKLYLRQEASEYLINSASLRGEDEVVMELIKLD